MTGYLIGVDGGGTKTDYVLFDTNGRCLTFRRGGATNHESLPGGFLDMKSELIRNLDIMLRENSLFPSNVSAAVFGLAGVDVPWQKTKAEEMISGFGIKNFLVMNDSFLGIKAGSPTGYGVCSINGTGTTAGGIDQYGNWLQIGGTGYFFGDEAGGGHIAGMAIRAVYDSICRFGPKTVLKERYAKFFDVSCPMKFTESVYDKYYTDIVDVKDLLGILFQSSIDGDAVSSSILERSGRQMGRSVAGCIGKLDFPDIVNVVLAGSVSLKCKSPVLLDSFKNEVSKYSRRICNYIHLDHPPVAGAIVWANELSSGHFDRVFLDKAVAQIRAFDFVNTEKTEKQEVSKSEQ